MLCFGFLVIRKENHEGSTKRCHERDNVVKVAAWDSIIDSSVLHRYEEGKLVYDGMTGKYLAYQNLGRNVRMAAKTCSLGKMRT